MNNLDIIELKKLNKYNKKNITKIKNGYPIQYIIGYVNFYGIKIIVNKNVLIPRYETETLIEKTFKYIEKYQINTNKILDLCTGSGAIGIALKKKFKNSKIDLADISNKALKVAKINIKNNNVQAEIIKSNLLNKVGKYNIIISNPPYVKTSEDVPIQLKYEPKIALFSKKNGTHHIEIILKTVSNHIESKGLLALEINEQSKIEITKLIKKYLYNVKYFFEKDLAGKTRYLFIFFE